MDKVIISEGKTTNEAIEKGLKELNVSKDMVDIKVLENEEKRSFFSILTPRVVKVEIKLKDEKNSMQEKKKSIATAEETEIAIENINKFLSELVKELPENTKYELIKEEECIKVTINNENLGFLIGYRGETLYALQNIMSAIASKNTKNRVRIILDIEGYKEKREKTLIELANKVAKTVLRTRKEIKLEPMQAYERKVIHTALQENNKIDTTSVGEEPYRRIVVSLKKK